MKARLLVLIAAATIAAGVLASTAQAGWSFTGWRCDNYGQIVHYSTGAALGCWYWNGGLYWYLWQ